MDLPPWTPCDCGEFWCNIHDRHAFECDCPPIEEWETDPYTAKEERPTTMPTATRPVTLRSQVIAELLAIRDSAAAELAVMPTAKQASEWARDRYADVDWCNRALARLGVDVTRPGAAGTLCTGQDESTFEETRAMEKKIFFQAARRGGRHEGIVCVSIETPPNPERNPDGTHDLFGETLEEATLPSSEAIEWLVARGCMRHEAVRMVDQVVTTFMATSTGAVPTTTEWVLGSPVERDHAED